MNTSSYGAPGSINPSIPGSGGVLPGQATSGKIAKVLTTYMCVCIYIYIYTYYIYIYIFHQHTYIPTIWYFYGISVICYRCYICYICMVYMFTYMGQLWYFTNLIYVHLGIISLINHDFQWGHSEVVIKLTQTFCMFMYPLVICYRAIEKGHWKTEFSHE